MSIKSANPGQTLQKIDLNTLSGQGGETVSSAEGTHIDQVATAHIQNRKVAKEEEEGKVHQVANSISFGDRLIKLSNTVDSLFHAPKMMTRFFSGLQMIGLALIPIAALGAYTAGKNVIAGDRSVVQGLLQLGGSLAEAIEGTRQFLASLSAMNPAIQPAAQVMTQLSIAGIFLSAGMGIYNFLSLQQSKHYENQIDRILKGLPANSDGGAKEQDGPHLKRNIDQENLEKLMTFLGVLEGADGSEIEARKGITGKIDGWFKHTFTKQQLREKRFIRHTALSKEELQKVKESYEQITRMEATIQSLQEMEQQQLRATKEIQAMPDNELRAHRLTEVKTIYDNVLAMEKQLEKSPKEVQELRDRLVTNLGELIRLKKLNNKVTVASVMVYLACVPLIWTGVSSVALGVMLGGTAVAVIGTAFYTRYKKRAFMKEIEEMAKAQNRPPAPNVNPWAPSIQPPTLQQEPEDPKQRFPWPLHS